MHLRAHYLLCTLPFLGFPQTALSPFAIQRSCGSVENDIEGSPPAIVRLQKKAPKLAATRHLIIRSCLSDLVSNLLQSVPPHPTPPFVRPTTQYSKHFDQKTKIYSEAFS